MASSLLLQSTSRSSTFCPAVDFWIPNEKPEVFEVGAVIPGPKLMMNFCSLGFDSEKEIWLALLELPPRYFRNVPFLSALRFTISQTWSAARTLTLMQGSEKEE